MSAANGYKPSPLGYGGSPGGVRNSPFRRPESPSSPSPVAHRITTPQTSPTKQSNASFAHQRLASTSASSPPVSPRAGSTTTSTTPRWGGGGSNAFGGNNIDNNSNSNGNKTPSSEHLRSPAPISRSGGTTPTSTTMPQSNTNGNALSQLQPAQVRTLRDGFQILDRNSDGVVTREDVADMLEQLGLPSSPSDLTKFFPPSAPQTMTLPVFINSIATNLASLSPSTELLSAFSAFDDDDSGQIDLAELRDALLNTAPEPGECSLTSAEVDRIVSGYSGRRAFSKSSIMMMGQNGGGGMGGSAAGKRGEVFRYQEFVQSIVGGGKGDGNGEGNDGSED